MKNEFLNYSYSKVENFLYIYKKKTMKLKILLNLSLLLITVLSLNTSFSQGAKTAKIGDNNSIQKSKEIGEFTFEVAGLTTDQVIKSASYYPLYFTVSYAEKNEKLSIKMVQSDAFSRRVIMRFFSALDIQNIESEGKTYLCDDFYLKFLQ
ncbi:MAG TPA: hypothetical protein DEF82_08175 [Crocinitomicaceae bacterium]|nr:hypothetical protein [Flavobacteriales bacterium]HBW86698.1 hypothetical protein [Crocinitomicaceae bacterium]